MAVNQGVPAPATSFPFVDPHGYLTPSAVQFLQPLATAAQGLSGPVTNDSQFSGFSSSESAAQSVSSTASAWSAVVAGSMTPGAQTYATQWGAQVDIGPVRLAIFSVILSALDGTTAGDVQIAGFPVPSSPSAVACGGWVSAWGATLTSGYTALGLSMAGGNGFATVVQSGSAHAPLALPSTGLSATSAFTGGVIFVR